MDIVLQSISDELRKFISKLHSKNRPDILLLSQLKAINLVKKLNGSSYLQDSELAEALFQLTITTDNPKSNIADFNYDKWQLDKSERDQIARSTKEFFKNKEIHTNMGESGYFEDNEMFCMLSNLGFVNYELDERGDKDE